MDRSQRHFGAITIGIMNSTNERKEMAMLRQFSAARVVLAVLPNVTRHQIDQEGRRC
jgi:hypothetical protein